MNSELGDRRQHDAQEFQIYLLDALHEDLNQVRNYYCRRHINVYLVYDRDTDGTEER